MSAPINDGGPAFAAPGMPAYSPEGVPLNPWAGYGWAHDPQCGMTLRDYFAGEALAGELSSWTISVKGREKEIAKTCYALADAMLAVRDGKGAE